MYKKYVSLSLSLSRYLMLNIIDEFLTHIFKIILSFHILYLLWKCS